MSDVTVPVPAVPAQPTQNSLQPQVAVFTVGAFVVALLVAILVIIQCRCSQRTPPNAQHAQRSRSGSCCQAAVGNRGENGPLPAFAVLQPDCTIQVAVKDELVAARHRPEAGSKAAGAEAGRQFDVESGRRMADRGGLWDWLRRSQ